MCKDPYTTLTEQNQQSIRWEETLKNYTEYNSTYNILQTTSVTRANNQPRETQNVKQTQKPAPHKGAPIIFVL